MDHLTQELTQIRIGKLERWILIHAYIKTVKKELPENWKLSRKEKHLQNWIKESAKKGITSKAWDKHLKDYWTYIHRSEILLNYFALDVSYKYPLYGNEKFRTTNKYKTALASLSRTLKRMEEKKKISRWYKILEKDVFIKLEDAGKKIANNFLNVNSW